MGYCAGKLFEPSVAIGRRRKALLIIGCSLIALFIVLRLINGYGDPQPWQARPHALASFLSFMNVNKYPPSLMYASITIGPALIALALLEQVQHGFTRFAQVYGRVPFFYYVIHFYLIHIFTVAAFFLSGYGKNDIVGQTPFLFRPVNFGFNLWFVYVIWIALVLLLYPLCKWYNNYKSHHFQWWLSYL
jgi:uncharacterized membrane protein